MSYSFPVISNISDVLPHIDDNFRVVEKEGFTFINYTHMGPDTFPAFEEYPASATADMYGGSMESQYEEHCISMWNLRAAVRRECRGITFLSSTGEIFSRPFHKFFNIGERPETAIDTIDISLPHVVLEKLDGSMICPFSMPGGFRWGTKMGFTDVGMLAEEFVASRKADGFHGYDGLAAFCAAEGLTCLFEFCSRRSRIVLDYPLETMVLLAVRHNVSGDYMKRMDVRALGREFDIPVVENVDVRGAHYGETGSDPVTIGYLGGFIDYVRADGVGEGKIILFDNGDVYKLKSDWYVRVHRAKDMMRSEMRLLDLILKGEVDDLLPMLQTEDKERINAYMVSFEAALAEVTARVYEEYIDVRTFFETKKAFALSDAASAMNSVTKSLIFGLWDGKHSSAKDAVMKTIVAGMSSETKFAETREKINLNTSWADIWQEDDV